VKNKAFALASDEWIFAIKFSRSVSMELASDVSDNVSEFYIVTFFSGDRLCQYGVKI
jgi:hypothetical protein